MLDQITEPVVQLSADGAYKLMVLTIRGRSMRSALSARSGGGWSHRAEMPTSGNLGTVLLRPRCEMRTCDGFGRWGAGVDLRSEK